MSTKFVMIQAIGFLGTITFFLSYQCKSNKKAKTRLAFFRLKFISSAVH